jgi:hypothetical protein
MELVISKKKVQPLIHPGLQSGGQAAYYLRNRFNGLPPLTLGVELETVKTVRWKLIAQPQAVKPGVNEKLNLWAVQQKAIINLTKRRVKICGY